MVTTGFALASLLAYFDNLSLYENIMLTITMSGLVVMLTPFFSPAVPREAHPDRPVTVWVAVLLCVGVMAIQLTNIVMWREAALFPSGTSIVIAFFSFTATLGVTLVFNSSYAFAFPPAAFPSLFLATTLPYDLAIAQYCLKFGNERLFKLQICLVGLKSLLVLAGLVLRRRLTPDRPFTADHQFFLPWSSFISIPGLSPRFSIGDLPDLLWDDGSRVVYMQFCRHWDQVDESSNGALLTASFRTLRPYLISSIPLHLCHIGFILSQPFLIRHIASTTFKDPQPSGTLFFNVGLTFFVYMGITITKFLCKALDDRASTAARGIFIAVAYEKMLRLRTHDIDPSILSTGLTKHLADVQLLLRSFQDQLWAMVHFVFGMALLYPLAGRFSLSILTPTLFVAVSSAINAVYESDRRRKYNDAQKVRARSALNIVAQAKSVKMMGLVSVVGLLLKQQFGVEVQALLSERHSRVIVFALSAFNYGVTPAFLLGTMYFGLPSGALSTPDVLACVALVAIISDGTSRAIERMTSSNTGADCLNDLQEYCMKPEMLEWRNPRSDMRPIIGIRFVESAAIAIEVSDICIISSLGQFIVRDLTMHLTGGGLFVIYGSVGCGKSTLVRAMLGELPLASGMITFAYDDIAFCGQEVWVQNITVRDNVIGDYAFLPTWYLTVTRACLVDVEVAALPDQNYTIAGTNGCELTECFRQKLGLARTIYGRAPVIFLDGVLSAVPPSQVSRILFNLFGPQGVIYEWRPTVVLATSTYGHLKHANKIFAMNDDGQVREYDNLSHFVQLGGLSSSAQTREVLYRNPTPIEMLESQAQQMQSCMFVEDEPHDEKTRDFSLYSYFQEPAGRKQALLFLSAVALAAGMKKLPDFSLGTQLGQGGLSGLIVVGYIITALASIYCGRLSGLILLRDISVPCSEALYARVVRTLLNSTPAFLTDSDASTMIKLFTEDASIISQDLPIAYMQLCSMAVTVLLNILILAATATYSVILLPVYFTLLYHAQKIYLPYFQQLRLLERQGLAAVAAHAAEVTTGIEHIRALWRQTDFQQEFYALLDRSQIPFYHRLQAHARLVLISDLFTLVSASVLVALAYAFRQSSTPAALGLALITLIRFSDETTFLVEIWTRLDDFLCSVLRVRTFCETTPLEKSQTRTIPPTWPYLGRIDFGSATTSGNDDEPEVMTSHNLEAVTFYVNPLQKTGLCSKIGHGQSALIHTLLRMQNYSGSIAIDGFELNTIPQNTLRSRITTLTQDGFELRASVRINLDPLSIATPFFTDLDFVGMLTRVGLWQVVNARGGLDADISQMHFTPAQKQLLGLARAALHVRRMRTRIVLVDKATSSLPRALDRQMQDFMDGEFARCTVITVVNRMSTIRTADKLLVLEAGVVKNVLHADYSEYRDEDDEE